MTRLKLLLSIIAYCLASGLLFAQEEMRVWTSYQAQARLSEGWQISAGQTFMFSQQPFELSSIQNAANLMYRFNGKYNASFGYVRSSDPSDPDQEARNRLQARFGYRAKLGKFRVTNSLRGEWHFPEASKFEYRIRYGLRVSRGNWGLPLNTTPFINNELHYYLSGRPLQYRDELGNPLVRQSPDGLHAHRITIGASFRPFNGAYATLSYMKQTEFNLGDRYREINVTDPRDGRILRPFNNFSVLTLSFAYRLDLREINRSTVSKSKKNSRKTVVVRN